MAEDLKSIVVHDELRAVFAEHETPTHCSKREVHDQLVPMVRLASRAQKQVLEYRERLSEAELAEHNPALDAKLEMMRQTLGSMERNSASLSHCARELAHDFSQADRYFSEWQQDVNAIVAARDVQIAAARAAGEAT